MRKKKAPARRGGSARRPAAGAGEPPQRTSLKGILLRAAIVSVLFYPYIIFVGDVDAGEALYVTLVAFLILIPVGFLMDTVFYRIRLRRYHRRRAGG